MAGKLEGVYDVKIIMRAKAVYLRGTDRSNGRLRDYHISRAKGQRGGRIDGGVAVLDGIGLLLFIIPGVIAFAVDFSTGAIYLPGSSRSSLDLKHAKVVRFDPNRCTDENLENIIKEQTGVSVKLSQAKITRLNQ